ncbi:efflux RND transporter periplasmic adaptor subunit [Laribacter hongkongensis]|uniref:efflux RND transporter periplasmic adaptor subunit n=1 Tax=Laribacter hongkongensis TaxID=168471 RepID=UPI001EFDA6FE|nr:efflux RND transporter periplasmic adaptor subunit [Laribacter hongkongensis]MCG9029726.1 efflux RND transporter periplasmic adaptor subunit [Laribacter hongkongensis]MCG9035809.1 efflux RND transporter periplasmic adaptor subunit [Laribacter hongkongensis]MCG9038575.1 efflux RND transporter periplasmic adaptor subunit [Laribacter hongkongensis]MCG9071534.1 efflux RND transporter periplasmic adaptor subunit [Laribacter hongkongensis]
MLPFRLLAGLLALALLTACQRPATPAAPASPVRQLVPQDLAHVRQATLTDSLPLSGPLAALNATVVSAEVEGMVRQVFVREGERVAAGTVLAEIDPQDARWQIDEKAAELAARRARLELAGKKLERQRQLAQEGFISPLALDELENDYRVSQTQIDAQAALLARARKTLGDTRVRAPFAGVITARQIDPGQSVNRHAPLFSLADLSTLEVSARVPARDIARVAIGQPARLVLDGGQQPFTASVVRINPVADAATRSHAVFLRVDNRDGRLPAGQYARGTLTLASTEAASLPLAALRDAGEAPWVLAVRGQQLVRQPVRTGLRDPVSKLVAVEGIAAGTPVVLAATLGVKPGDRVRLAQ